MLKDPVTKKYSGHALVDMMSPEQAQWVMSDLNDMMFAMSVGPHPVQASVARQGNCSCSTNHASHPHLLYFLTYWALRMGWHLGSGLRMPFRLERRGKASTVTYRGLIMAPFAEKLAGNTWQAGPLALWQHWNNLLSQSLGTNKRVMVVLNCCLRVKLKARKKPSLTL